MLISLSKQAIPNLIKQSKDFRNLLDSGLGSKVNKTISDFKHKSERNDSYYHKTQCNYKVCG